MSVPNRRASHIGVLRPSQGNDGKPAARRQSLSVGFASRDNENLSVKPRQDNNNNINNNNNNNTPAMSTPAAKAPSEQKRPASSSHHHHHQQRTNLGSASAYYFANQPKTPMEKAAKARKKLSTSLNQSINNNNSMNESSIMDDECFTLLDNSKTGNDYTGTLPSSAMESSYFSSSSDSNADGDLLNQSTLSDTTEMSAANYVLLNAARQRWSLGGAQPPTAKPPPEQMPPPTNRRKTLPPGLVVPPAANVTEKAYQVAADMKERRLSRQSLGSRFSLGSELAPSPEEPAEEQTADSLASLPTDTSSPPNNIAVNMENNSDPHNTSTASDDSVASLGSLFDDMLPQGNQRKSETASDLADFTLRPSLANDLFQAGAEKEEATDKSMESEGKSVSTQEAVGFSSQTSQLGTPVEASEDNVAHSPRPLPETVAFESAEAPASPAPSVEVASPHKAKSPRRSFSLTRKLSQSPVRMIDSPARNTRNSKQKRLSLSAEKKRKLSIELADDVSVAKRGRKSSLASTTLNSSFRKASSRQHGSARKVAFGSPDVVEFHVTSPSMSLTPMPKPSAKDRFGIPEDTQEIEADMNALLENMHNPDAVAKLSAGHTPYASRRDVLEESTRELEKNLDEVLNEAAEDSLENDTSGQPDDDDDDASDMSDDSQAGRLAGEHTRALEIGMDELLAQNADESQQAASGIQSVTANDEDEEDQTVELEADMGALLMAADAFPPDPEPLEIVMADDDTPVAGHRRSSIASRRFSLATKSRLSLDNTTEFLATRMEETSDDTPEKVAPEPEPVLEIKVEQVLTVASTNASLAVTMSDIFTKATEFLQKNPSSLVAETYGTFLKEICNHVASGQVPGVDPEYFGQLSEQEQARCIKLQECLRSDNKVVTEQSLGKLMDFATQEEKRALEKWLLDTANQVEDFLTGHIEDLSTERERVLQELKGIDDAECFLSTLKERAARKARRLSLQRRKVSRAVLTIICGCFTLPHTPFLSNHHRPKHRLWKKRFANSRRKLSK